MTALNSPDAEPKPTEPVLMLIRQGPTYRAWISAQWYGKFELKADEEALDLEAHECDDEGNETYYCKPGWYEKIENWPDYCAISISGELLGWIPMPPMPEGA